MKTIGYLLSKVFAASFLLTAAMPVNAQDPHLSQYDASPVIMNPSHTGMLDRDDMRAVTQYRNQWNSLASRLTSTSIAFDAAVDKQYGAGIYLVDDDAAKAFSTLSVVFVGAYRITSPIQRRYRLSVGLNVGFIYKQTKDNKLVFDNQYYAGVFNPDLPSGENFPKLRLWMPETGFGFSYVNTNDGKLFNPYSGISVFHVTNPKESFYGNRNNRLPMRFMVNGGTKINPATKVIIDPNMLLMKQKNNYEVLAGVRGGYILTEKIAAVAGIYYRWRDAVIAMVGFNYNNYVFRVSYDFTVSNLKKYNGGWGGLEFSLLFQGSAKTSMISKF
ncbi:MAG: PorP/SprF family type IX secretion system membrane protein [Bacteroidetes bacterium]|nr:PorP/SprF family type IX secretion system membrane protein [Bacteroidota bacterium]